MRIQRIIEGNGGVDDTGLVDEVKEIRQALASVKGMTKWILGVVSTLTTGTALAVIKIIFDHVLK